MKILKQLSEAMGVSGAEGEVRKLILDQITGHVDEVRTDKVGNVLALKRGTGGGKRMTVMIDAHMDEVGLMVTGHDSHGMLKVAAVGGLDERILPGTRVLVGPKKTPGVIGAKPVHLLGGGERDKAPDMDSLRVDIGAKSKDAAEGKAKLGTRIGFDSRYVEIGQTVRGKALDNRVGCAMLIHLLRGEQRYPFDLWGAFTVQEEIGKVGARVASYSICPDAAFVFDVTAADDLPQPEGDDTPRTTEMGKGPGLSVMDPSAIYDARLNRLLMETAEALEIPTQIKRPGIGGTDGSEILRAHGGVPVAVLYVPCRYIHSPAAMFSKKDYGGAVKLIEGALARLEWGTLER